MKKTRLVGATLAVAVGVLGLTVPHAYAATTTTCSWAGVGADKKFSTVANWTCDGGLTVPDTTSAVTIDLKVANGTGSDAALINDLATAVGSLDVTNSDTSSYQGASLDKLGLVDGGTITNKASNGNLSLASLTSTGSVTMTYAPPASGPMNLSRVTVTGALTVNGGQLDLSGVTAGSIIVNGDASLYAHGSSATVSYPEDIVINQGFISVYESCTEYDQTTHQCLDYTTSTVTFAGTVTLNSDTQIFVGKKDIINVVISKALAGTGKLSYDPSSQGDLTIAGVSQPYAVKTTTINSQTDCKVYDKSQSITVSRNETGVLNSATVTYGNVVVDGVLKGNGTFVHCTSGTSSWGGYLIINEGAYIAPGNSPGLITTDHLDLNGIYQFQFGGDTAGTGYDQIVVTNYVASTTTPTNKVVVLGATAKLVTERLGTYTPKKGKVFTIIDNQSANAVQGTFSGLPEGATFAANGVLFKISYVGGNGNDVTLTVMNQPTVPNTGFAVAQTNPFVMAAATILATGALIVIGRKLQTARH